MEKHFEYIKSEAFKDELEKIALSMGNAGTKIRALARINKKALTAPTQEAFQSLSGQANKLNARMAGMRSTTPPMLKPTAGALRPRKPFNLGNLATGVGMGAVGTMAVGTAMRRPNPQIQQQSAY